MPIRIFISHSVAPRELVLVNAMAEEAARRGVTPSIPDRDWVPNNRIPKRIRRQIEDSDYIIAIASERGHHSQWLNAEIIYNQRLSSPKPLLLVTDATIQVDPSYERIIINYSNPLGTISEVSHRIQRLIQDKNAQNLVAGVLIGGLTLLLLYSLKED
ncbi:MAG: toll/interleukin-1 receptor domain-containing protein [Candidatus Methanofastidiosia archaeon]